MGLQLLLLTSTTAAEELEFTLEEAVQRALTDNLSLKSGAFDPAVAQTDILAARSVFDPVLFAEHNWSAFAEPLGNDFLSRTIRRQRRAGIGIRHTLPVGWSYSVEYRNDYDHFALDRNQRLSTSENNVFTRLVIPFMRGAGSHVNRAGVNIAELAHQSSIKAFEQSALDLVLEVEQAYWALVQSRLVQEVRTRALQNSREFLGLLEKEIQHGKSAPYEAYEAQQNVSSRERDLEEGAQQVVLAEQALSRLMGIDPGTISLIPTQLPSQNIPEQLPTLEASFEEALERRPLLSQVDLSLLVLGHQLVVAKNQLLPSLNAVGEHRLGNSNTGPYSWLVGLELEVPLGNRRARADADRLEVLRQKTLVERDDLRQRVRLEVAQALGTFDIARRRVIAAKEASVMAEKRVEAELSRFRAGFTPSHRVIFSQQQQIVTDEDEAVSLVNLELARSSLRRAVGSALKEYKMTPKPRFIGAGTHDPRKAPIKKDASEEAGPPTN